jgi:hypothetical protein
MKKILMSMAMFFISATPLLACEICGANFTSQNPYLFSHQSRSYIGLSFQHSHYNLYNEGVLNKQQSSSFSLLTQFAISKRINLLAVFPFQSNTITSTSTVSKTTGISDVSVLLNYNALQKSTGKLTHFLSIGGGLKLPTGKYRSPKEEQAGDQNYQLGTGSFDFLLSCSYRLTLGNFSFNALSSYTYTNTNKDGYRYGDVLTTAATTVYSIKKQTIVLSPYVQLINEHHYMDAVKKILQDHSEGSILTAASGVDVSKDKITFGLSYHIPLQQNLMKGELEANPKIAARISFTL